jgi:hypothetical protein
VEQAPLALPYQQAWRQHLSKLFRVVFRDRVLLFSAVSETATLIAVEGWWIVLGERGARAR